MMNFIEFIFRQKWTSLKVLFRSNSKQTIEIFKIEYLEIF